LRVRADRQDLDLDLLELLGEQLSNAVVNAFRLVPDDQHRPLAALHEFCEDRNLDPIS
jgi:hypothetical protein